MSGVAKSKPGPYFLRFQCFRTLLTPRLLKLFRFLNSYISSKDRQVQTSALMICAKFIAVRSHIIYKTKSSQLLPKLLIGGLIWFESSGLPLQNQNDDFSTVTLNVTSWFCVDILCRETKKQWATTTALVDVGEGVVQKHHQKRLSTIL